MDIVRSWGLEPVPGPLFQAYLEGRPPLSPLSYLAASDELRWQELEWALGGDWAALWVVRGGYGLTRLLPRLGSQAWPLPVLGFSDVSALLYSLQRRRGSSLVHCANVQTLPCLRSDALQATREWLMEGRISSLRGSCLRPGQGEGPLYGGNLCVLASLCGTDEALLPGPKVLFLEDINEAPYRVDRLLTQLGQSGAFEGLLGVALGRFTGCGDLGPVWAEWVERWRVPVVADLPFGHCEDNFPLPLGQRVQIDQNQISWVLKSMQSGSGAGSASSP
jgi:muramoyltetrapeptide carboxypeptidase